MHIGRGVFLRRCETCWECLLRTQRPGQARAAERIRCIHRTRLELLRHVNARMYPK